LAAKKGDVEDHCNLLCSLFLGFGLNAYVVVGTNENGNFYWVLQLMDDKVIFWESLSG
jgi:centrosomal protein CEP76